MELPDPGTFTLSATGRAREVWEVTLGSGRSLLGDYNLTEELSNGRPVYESSEGWSLYSTESGVWVVDGIVGQG